MNLGSIHDAVYKVPEIKGLRISVADGDAEDEYRLNVEFEGRRRTYKVYSRTVISTTAVTVLAARLESSAEKNNCLVHAPFISNACGEMLVQNDINFLDDQGHVYLHTENLCLLVLGRVKRSAIPQSPIPLQEPRHFNTAALKVIYAFLSDPALDTSPKAALLNRTYREIADATGVSLGSVSYAMDNLVVSGFVVEETSERRRLINRHELFERWVPDYGARLRSKQVVARFRPPDVRWWEKADLADWGLWGGEVAGAKLTQFLTPETATIYASSLPDSFIIEHDLRKDPAGTVEVLKPLTRVSTPQKWAGCVHPLLVYADLTATDIDRNLQTAQRIYDRHLRQLIESD